jgi:sortase A
MRRFIRRATLVAGFLLIVAGLLALAYAAYVVFDARSYQVAEHRRLESTRQQSHAGLPTRDAFYSMTSRSIAEGTAIGEIRIPRLELTAVVAQGESADVLQRAIGHLADTSLPWESGNVVLAGHRDTFFRSLKWIRIGDAIELTTPYGDFEYLVEWTAVVGPDHIDVVGPTGRSTVTLITCFPFSYVGPAPKRFVVRARETSRYVWSRGHRTTLRR